MAWLRALAAEHAPNGHDRRGTLRHIDSAARRRAAEAVVEGRSISLARPLVDDEGFTVDVSYGEPAGRPEATAAFDVLTVACHGLTKTHIDGLNHFAYDGTLYSGWPTGDPDGPTPDDWSATGVFTRALHADICAVRGETWCDPAQPVTAADLDAAIAALDTECLPGDAVLVDMGRHRYEADGQVVRSQLTSPAGYRQPGLGPTAAAWIAEHRVGTVCWDFLDAIEPDLCQFSGHGLIWAVGQVFIDNCNYAALGESRAFGEFTGIGALSVAPLPAPRTTGSVCNPLVLF